MKVESKPSGPLVSVAVPAYNAAATIDDMITSVLAQSMVDFELVVCDDASNDDTAARVLAHGDPRIRLVRQRSNSGEGAARDAAIGASSGRWIALLDADDAWLPDRLDQMLRAAGHDDQVMVFDDLWICRHSEKGMVPYRRVRGRGAFGVPEGDAGDVSLESYIRAERLLMKPLIPRRFLANSSIRHSTRKFAADSEFFIRLGMAGLRMRYLALPLYLYRVTPGSATASATGKHLMRECLEELAAGAGVSATVRNALEAKVGALREREALYELATAIRKLRIGEVVSLLRAEPRLAIRASIAAARKLAHLAEWILRGAFRR